MSAKLTLVLLIGVGVVALVHSAPVNKAKLTFKVSGRNLPDKDSGPGKTDGYFELFSSEDGGKTRKKIGRSDTINNELNPNWGTTFNFDFDRNKEQLLYFKVWDDDTLAEDDNVGRVWVNVKDYVDKGQLVNANLDKQGYLTIQSPTPQPPPDPNTPLGYTALPAGTPESQTLRFKLSASGLPTKDDIGFIPGNSDPYVIVYLAEGPSGKEVQVGRSATVSSTKNPTWGDLFSIQWNRKKDQRLHFRIFDDDNLREDDKLGSGWLEVNDYMAHGQAITFNIPKGGKITMIKA